MLTSWANRRTELYLGFPSFLICGEAEDSELQGTTTHASTDRAQRILAGEDRVRDVVEPGEIEHVALGSARRVVREAVEERVQHLERRRQVRRRVGELGGRRGQLLHDRRRDSRERPQLVLDDRGRLQQERTGRDERWAERASARPQRAERRSGLVGERLRLTERSVRVAQRGRQQRDRALQVRVLVREALEDLVRAVDERRQLLVARGERVREDAEVVDRAADVLAALGEQLRESGRVACGRLEATEDLREVAAVALEPRRRAVQQHLQVRARVAVEHREDLVEVHVRQRVGDGDHVPVSHRRTAGRGARVRARRSCPSGPSSAAAASSRSGGRGARTSA